MSNIGTPRRTEPRSGGISQGRRRHRARSADDRWSLSALPPTARGRRPYRRRRVNQFGFGSLGAVGISLSLLCCHRQVIASLFSPWWLMLLAFLALL